MEHNEKVVVIKRWVGVITIYLLLTLFIGIFPVVDGNYIERLPTAFLYSGGFAGAIIAFCTIIVFLKWCFDE
jgi:hypothetical protein